MSASIGTGSSTEETPQSIPFSLLALQNAETSSAVIQIFRDNAAFAKLAQFEGDLTEARDKEDDDKLQTGIDIARAKGVIDPNLVPAPYTAIDVLGQTPEQVADRILSSVQEQTAQNQNSSSSTTSSSSSSAGYVIVIVGRSGTGKGTTVAQLVDKVAARGQAVVTWSNGNVFRALTLLATNYAQENKVPLANVLTKERLADFMKQISISTSAANSPPDGTTTTASSDTKNQPPPFDILIDGIGRVSEVQNTLLKSPVVSKNIPTVAEATQGEVILFCGQALNILAQQGVVVLLEGREPTVNYVPTPFRFELVLSEGSLIGQRRAAQRIFGQAYQQLKSSSAADDTVSDQQVMQVLEQVLNEMVQAIP